MEYKFRGKRLDNGEWVAGHYLTQRNNEHGLRHMISVQDMWRFHEVDPSTVGQYTGLKDKNGVEIYEGDRLGMYADENLRMLCEIVFEFDGFKFMWLEERVSEIRGKKKEPIFRNIKFFEVIGNIHDSELLEG